MNKLFEVDCTKRCKSRIHGQSLTSAITKRSVSDESLASFIKLTCSNFSKAIDFEGRTALHMAASRGRNGLMEWLVRHSSDAFVNARDRESGYTPLHRSIFYGQIHTAVALLKLGVNTDIVDKDDYKALDHALLDKHYMFKCTCPHPCDVYVWGSNSNYTLGTGSHQPRNVPELLTCFSRISANVRQVCLGKFHSVWLTGYRQGCEVWCAGQPARAGGPHSTALRPAPLKLPEACLQVAITLNSTLFLLQSGSVLQYSLNNTDNPSPSSVKYPPTIKLMSAKPVIKISEPLGICASRCHAVVWNEHGVYTWGLNLGQLGHSQQVKNVSIPKKVAISVNNYVDPEFQLVDASDAATVITTGRGDVYLIHKHICKKIAIKQINVRQVCVEAKVSDQGVYSRVTVLFLTKNVGQLVLWQDTTNKLTRCVFGLNHQTIITHMALTHDAVYFTTNLGEAFVGNISRRPTSPSAQPVKKERDNDNKSALVKFLEREDCTPVKITKIPNIHRAAAIAVDSKGLNFACLQNKPTTGLTALPDLSPSSFSKHMESLLVTVAEDDILHDVIFKVGSKLFPAHAFIVASSSNYLYKLYKDARTDDTKPTITLENVHPEVFQRILSYMYTGTCDVAELGPCGLKIRREDLNKEKKEKEDDNEDVETEIEVIDYADVPILGVYKNPERKKGNKRRTITIPRQYMYCDPIKLVQATAKRLHVMGLHKLLDKFYYRDDNVQLKDSAIVTKNAPMTWNRENYPDLVDTSVCSKDGIPIPAHKCVLAARLEYFQGMFMHTWTESKLLSKVSLPINHTILLPVMNFLYTDACPEVDNTESIDFICSMLIVADQLLITHLREMCEVSLGYLITLKNCTELCQFAHTYNAAQLKRCCMQFISLNIGSILENRSLDLLEESLLEDISKYYCEFNPIMSSRIVTPFFNAPSDEIIDECTRILPVDMQFIDEDVKKDDIIEVKKKKQKKIEYTENEKARMRYESVSSITSLELSNNASGDVTLSLNAISKDEEKKIRETEKWTEVPTSQHKQQKVVQARLKAISSAKEILNEPPASSFTKLTKNNSSSAIQDTSMPTTSRVSLSPNALLLDTSRGQGNLVISHVGPKLSQKQRKKLALEGEQSPPRTLDDYLFKLPAGSPPDKPKNPWKICETPSVNNSPNKSSAMEFNQILADQKKQKGDSSRIMTKPLALTQLEDKAIEDLERFYNIHEVDDELITVKRIELQVSSPQWIHTASK